MMLSLPTSVRIWLATRATDLRKSFDSLAELVRQHLKGDPLSGQLFVFRNKRADRVTGFISTWRRQHQSEHPPLVQDGCQLLFYRRYK